MSLTLWGMLCSVPYNLICFRAITRMVRIRRPLWFGLAWQLGCLPIFLIPIEGSYGWLRTILPTALWTALVLLFAEKHGLRTVFAAALISLFSVVAEVLASMLSVLLFGRYVETALLGSDPETLLAVQIIFWNIFALLCWALTRVWKRSVRPQEENHMWRFAFVPLSQHFLVMFSAAFSLTRRTGAASYLLLGAMALCCALADFFLFRGLRQYTAQQLASRRVELLEEQLRQQVEYYDRVVAGIEETARLRHDLRNQLQTARVLMERGEYDEAGALLNSYAARLTAGKEGE